MTALLTPLMIVGVAASGFGDCSGDVQSKWLDDGRKMELLSDYTYRDESSFAWRAAKGSIVDGASIPRFLWALIGGPFEGKYRKASVVHDVACVDKTETWQRVHRMFHDACLCSGVPFLKAKIMYAAVYHFGPRWSTAERSKFVAPEVNPEAALRQFRQIQAYLEANPNVPLEAVESLTPDDVSRYEPAKLDLREPDEARR